MPRSLRLRAKLALAFTAVSTLLFSTLGGALYLVMSYQLNDAADAELWARASNVEAFLERKDTQGQVASLADQLREHSGLSSKEDSLKLQDGAGDVVYQSGAMSQTPDRGLPEQPYQFQDGHHHVYRVLTVPVRLSNGDHMLTVASDRSEYYEALLLVGTLLLLGIPVVIVLSSAGGAWMSGRALSPVRTIVATLRTINSRRLTVRLKVSGNGDELDQLSITANAMLDELHHAFERITRFTADASHELRTPLSLIRGHAELLLNRDAEKAEVLHHADELLEQASRMQALIGDLLALARSDADTTQPFEMIDPADLVERAAAVGRQLAGSKGIQFTLRPIVSVHPLFGDDAALFRVLLILLDNAIRYTPGGGCVSLELCTSAAACSFSVQDNGTGIKEENLSLIFDRFFREDSSRDRESGGTGLGLSIAQSIVLAHGGTIAADSNVLRGTVVRFAIPHGSEVRPSS